MITVSGGCAIREAEPRAVRSRAWPGTENRNAEGVNPE
jgi:hypothetical protein